MFLFSTHYHLSLLWLQSAPAVFHPNLLSRSNLATFAAAVVTLGEDEELQLSLACYCRLNQWNLIRLDFFMAAYGCLRVERCLWSAEIKAFRKEEQRLICAASER